MDASRLPDLAQGDGLGPAWRLRQRAHPCPPGGDHPPGPTCGDLPAIPDRLPFSDPLVTGLETWCAKPDPERGLDNCVELECLVDQACCGRQVRPYRLCRGGPGPR